MTPQQQKNVELIRALRKKLKELSLEVHELMKCTASGEAGRKEIVNASTSLTGARVALTDALGEIGRAEFQQEDEV